MVKQMKGKRITLPRRQPRTAVTPIKNQRSGFLAPRPHRFLNNNIQKGEVIFSVTNYNIARKK